MTEILLWILGLLGAAFVALVGAIGTRLVIRIDDLNKLLQADIRNLLHDHDKRITALEIWRDTAALERAKP